jgi:hypothetical protein
LQICPQEIAQSVGTMPNEAKVSSSNPPPSSYVDMSKKNLSTNFGVVWLSHETRHIAVQGLSLAVILRLLHKQATGQALSLAFKFYEFAQKI